MKNFDMKYMMKVEIIFILLMLYFIILYHTVSFLTNTLMCVIVCCYFRISPKRKIFFFWRICNFKLFLSYIYL